MPKHAEDARARAEARFRKQYEDNQVADQARVRIPTHAGHLFRDDVGHRSDLMPATVPR
jgi:hypothetical protein